MTATCIFTLLFLLADGAPASKARVHCLGIEVYQAGDEQGAPAPEDSELIVDSRGAVIITGPLKTITCWAQKAGQSFVGPIALERDRSQIRIYLKEQAQR